jgi:hypothetical protein
MVRTFPGDHRMIVDGAVGTATDRPMCVTRRPEVGSIQTCDLPRLSIGVEAAEAGGVCVPQISDGLNWAWRRADVRTTGLTSGSNFCYRKMQLGRVCHDWQGTAPRCISRAPGSTSCALASPLSPAAHGTTLWGRWDVTRLRGGAFECCFDSELVAKTERNLRERRINEENVDFAFPRSRSVHWGNKSRNGRGDWNPQQARRLCLARSFDALCWSCVSKETLQSILFESGSRLKRIKELCFRHCPLQSICIPRSVELLCQSCFSNPKLESISFGSE